MQNSISMVSSSQLVSAAIKQFQLAEGVREEIRLKTQKNRSHVCSELNHYLYKHWYIMYACISVQFHVSDIPMQSMAFDICRRRLMRKSSATKEKSFFFSLYTSNWRAMSKLLSIIQSRSEQQHTTVISSLTQRKRPLKLRLVKLQV